MELNFMSRLDSAIFKNFNPNHRPVTGVTSVYSLVGGAIISLVVFVLQMFSANDTLIEVVASIGVLALLGWIIKMSLASITAFATWTPRILYGLYIVVLFGICFMIAMWLVVIALLLLLLWGMAKIFFSGSSGKSKARVRYGDGTESEARETGKGICGETYYEDDRGNTFVKP